MSEIRTERRFGVTAQLTPEARRALFTLRQQDGWPVLLDVMEMVCIETETELINTPAENEAAILANHKMSRAAWQLFTHLQQRVEDEVSRYVYGASPKPPEPDSFDEEREVESIVNPLSFYSPNESAAGESEETEHAQALVE